MAGFNLAAAMAVLSLVIGYGMGATPFDLFSRKEVK
jgi:hypothetical protein